MNFSIKVHSETLKYTHFYDMKMGVFQCLRVYNQKFLSGSVGEKFPGQMGSLEFFTALPDKIFCLGLSSHSWPSGKFVYARYARYTNSNALLRLRLSSINVFSPHFVRAKNWPSGLKRLSSPRQILLHCTKVKMSPESNFFN